MRLRAWGMIGVAGAVGAGVAAWGLFGSGTGTKAPKTAATRPVEARSEADASVSGLAAATSRGDVRALMALKNRFDAGPGDLEAWVGVPASLRTGFGRFGGAVKVSTLELAGSILAAFGKSPAPSTWAETLVPTRGLFTAGISDVDPSVRASALGQIGAMWGWIPDRTLLPVEEIELTAWKTGLHAEVIRHLHDDSALVRAAVASCLAALPLDAEAAPALELAKDADPVVRSKVLLGFAARPELLSVEEILPYLHDRSEIANVAAIVLKTRGLTVDQIQLAKMLVSPKPEVRASSIPLLVARTEIDPAIWLIFLSRDADESVRSRAVAAFEGRVTPDVRRRLDEVVASDPSPSIRAAARKLIPADETTAALPPLPGSPSLNPRAN